MRWGARYNRQPKTNQRGITLLEIILVIALVGVAAAMVAPSGSASLGTREVSATAELVTDALREAQFSAMSSQAPKEFGVYFESGRFVRYQGATYLPADPDNQEQLLNDNLTLTVSLTGGVSAVHFDNHRGLPDVTGTITVSSDLTDSTQVITIGPEGAIGR
jgi:prepilin-type N-terminal cleavage/methylation domain-containing protein